MNSKDNMNTCYVVFPRGGQEKIISMLTERDLAVSLESQTLVFFDAELAHLYELLLNCPFASRMGKVLALRQDLAKDLPAEERLAALDELLNTVDWPYYLPDMRVQVSVKASSGLNIHEQFTAKRVHQRLVPAYFQIEDDFSSHELCPSIRVIISEESLWIGLEAGSNVLYPRLSPSRGQASLKENLAALVGSYISEDDVELVIDPMCGSGTLLLETLAQVANIQRPPPRWQILSTWPDYNEEQWQLACEQASTVKPVRGAGFDTATGALKAARDNFQAFREWNQAANQMKVHWERRDLHQAWPKPVKDGRAWVVINPPYGKRLGEGANLAFLYAALGQQLQAYSNEVQAAGGKPVGYTVISSHIELLDGLRLPYEQHARLYNGADQIFLRSGLIPAKTQPVRAPLKPVSDIAGLSAEIINNPLFIRDFAQRLHKNYKKMANFLQQPVPKSGKGLSQGILSMLAPDCFEQTAASLRLFRLYNADIPEFNCAIDVYEHCVYLQEYKAPSSVDATKATYRIEQITFTLSAVLQIPQQRILTKARQRQVGRQQYSRQGDDVKLGPLDGWHQRKQVFTMSEWGSQFIVNLGDYIDTGLFLDHRRLRWLVRALAPNKHVLNLFSYTGAFSVHAAAAGAASTTSVDLSPRYVAWAEHNFMANGIGLERHQVIRADVVSWLETHSNQYDIIIIDPPTFSNSKKADDFIVQEHHEQLIRQAMRHLQGGGILFFSCNMKKFTLAPSLAQDFQVNDISYWTQSLDFQGKTGPNQTGGHQCWVLQAKV